MMSERRHMGRRDEFQAGGLDQIIGSLATGGQTCEFTALKPHIFGNGAAISIGSCHQIKPHVYDNLGIRFGIEQQSSILNRSA